MSDTGIVKIHGKEYRTVGKRIADFRAAHPDWSITSEVLSAAQLVMVKATILDDEGRVIATGHAEEERGSTNINKTSALENAETGAVGRCLAMLGMGGTEIASADEVVNAISQQGQKEIYERMQQFTDALVRNIDSVRSIQATLSDATAENVEFAREAFRELSEADQYSLWLATSKGGCFTTNERKLIKEGLNG